MIEQIAEICVKIICYNGGKPVRQGSGTIISSDSHYFVMTAAHCIGDGKEPYPISDINIYIHINNADINIGIFNIIGYDEGDDYALLEIEKPITNFDHFHNVKCFVDKPIEKEEYYFYGYTKLHSEGRLYCTKQVSSNFWHIKDNPIDGQCENAQTLMRGNSGAGVFFERHGSFYFVGYLKGLRDENGSYSDLRVIDICVFNNLLPISTRQHITVELLTEWSKKEKEKVDKQLVDDFRIENVTWMDNLIRKTNALYNDDTNERIDDFLDSYIKGGNIIKRMKDEDPRYFDELSKDDDVLFQRISKQHPKRFRDEFSAQDDLKQVRQELHQYADKHFPEDDATRTISNGYVEYRVAEKLLNCTLQYNVINL